MNRIDQRPHTLYSVEPRDRSVESTSPVRGNSQESTVSKESTVEPAHLGPSEITQTTSQQNSLQYRPVYPFSSDFTASALRYSNMRQVSRASKIASSTTAAEESHSTKTIISDDFPEPSPPGKFLGDFYAMRCNAWMTYWNPPEFECKIDPITKEKIFIPKRKGVPLCVNDSNPLSTYQGITGLNNFTGSCGVNAALQTVRIVLETMLTLESPEKSQQLRSTIQQKTPQLWRFLNNEIVNEGDRRGLHREVAQKMTEDFWYSHFSGIGIAQQSLDAGYINGSYPSHITLVLLHQLKAPQVYFEQSLVSSITGNVNKTHHSAQALLLESTVIVNKVNYRYRSNQLHDTGLRTELRNQIVRSSEKSSIQQLIDKTLCQQGRKLEEPVPYTLVILLKNTETISEILEPISFTDKNGALTIYQPKSILCRNTRRNHAFSILRKNGIWYEVNDNLIYSIPKSWKDDLDCYCSKHTIMIVYGKSESQEDLSLLTARQEEWSLEDQRADNILQEINSQIQRTYWPKFEPCDLEIGDTVAQLESVKYKSFFLNQAYGVLKQQIEKERLASEVNGYDHVAF